MFGVQPEKMSAKVAESALLVSLPHISSSATAKVCKLHQIVVSRGAFNISSQGAINIRNSAKFTDLFPGLKIRMI